MENEEINVLDELNKGTSMGRDAIYFLLDKVEDESLKKELNREYDEYRELSNEIATLYPDYSEDTSDTPKKTSTMNKMMTWYGIEMQTMLDKTPSKIAELVIKGMNMGIIEGRKLLNNKSTNKEVEELINDYIDMQERALDKLKKYL